MIVTADKLLTALKYDESEIDTLEMFRQGAIAVLKNAGAYRETNDLTSTVVTLIVGFWMDNRELNFTDFKNIRDFPLGMQALMNQLKYSEPDIVGGDIIA